MHVLIARTPGGFTHAVSCETSAEFGTRFIHTMEVQGCAVERLTLAEYAEQRRLPAVPVPKGAPWTEEVPVVCADAAPVEEPVVDAADLPVAELPTSGLRVGDEVQASLIGAATVTHVLTYPDGTRLAVARSRRGEQLLRPGTPHPAAAAPAPAIPVPVVTPAAPSTRMLSLFGDLS